MFRNMNLVIPIFLLTVVATEGNSLRRPCPPNDPNCKSNGTPTTTKLTDKPARPSPPQSPPPANGLERNSDSQNYRLIYDVNCGVGGEWVQVYYEECPIAFDDPEFASHDYICK